VSEPKFSGWRAGRMDAVSYDGDGDGPYKQVYVDNPNGRMQGADCREVALVAAAGPDAMHALHLFDVWNAMPADRGGNAGRKGRAYAAFIAAKDAALKKAREG